MFFKLIVAYCDNGGIGINNNLPWYFPNDLKRFSKLTRGEGNNAILMGRKTWQSLPNKFLPKRDNLILSRTIQINETKNDKLLKSFSDIDDIIKFCKNKNYDDIWIIGGEQIYKMFLSRNLVKQIYATVIHKTYNCDAFFNTWDKQKFFILNNTSINEKEIDEDICIDYITYQLNTNID